MRTWTSSVVVFCLLACNGCARQKSTAELLQDLKSHEEGDRIRAARILPQHEGDASQVIPALIEALNDKQGDVRWSAAIGLGNLGEEAKEAIPALQAVLSDRDPRVREAARVAITRIDPSITPKTSAGKAVGKK